MNARKAAPAGSSGARMLFFKKFKEKNKEYLDLIYDAGTIGIQLVVSTFIGMGMGYYLDKWLGTKPWMLIIFLILGIVAGFKNVYHEAKKILDAEKKKADEHKRNSSQD
jgi:ATP synthase protein I